MQGKTILTQFCRYRGLVQARSQPGTRPRPVQGRAMEMESNDVEDMINELLLRRKMLDDRRELFVSDYKDQVVVVVLGSLTSTRNMKNRQIKLNSGKAKKSVFHPLHLCFISDHCCLL